MENWITFDDVLIVPAYSDIESRQEVDTSTDFLGLKLNIPIISANMDYVTGVDMAIAMHEAGGLGILHRFAPLDKQIEWMDQLDKRNIPFVISVGIRDLDDSWNAIEAARDLPNLFAVCIDVAHGHHKKVGQLTEKVKTKTDLKVIAGNVATSEGAQFLKDSGADAIKVGIGAGAVCTTRSVAGVGVPQLSAIIETADIGIPVIADGGIRSSADIAKALIAGASAVMVGSLLAGTAECPSPTVTGEDGKNYRPYRGQSIFGTNGERYVREGIEGFVEEKGPVAGVLRNLQAGLRSSMSYVGARNIAELKEKGKVIIVSGNTGAENATRVRQNI